MGANIALLHYNYYYYYVSIDSKLHVNEQPICKLYTLHSESEQCATDGVLRELLNYRDGIYVIEYLTYDEMTLIIDEWALHNLVCAILICINLYSLSFFLFVGISCSLMFYFSIFMYYKYSVYE